MRQHESDDLAVAVVAVAISPLVHDCRKSRTETVRHMLAVKACPIEQIANGVLAHGPVRMARAGLSSIARVVPHLTRLGQPHRTGANPCGGWSGGDGEIRTRGKV